MSSNIAFLENIEKKSLRANEVKNKTILLRVDLNVPLNDEGHVINFAKIKNILPTLLYLLQNNNKLIIVTHLGRPKSKESKFSTKVLIPYLNDAIKNYGQVKFLPWVENLNQHKEFLKKCTEYNVFLLENIRFFIGEIDNNIGFAKDLASIADIFVNDAFACCHRSHSSICGVTNFLESYFGLSLLEEVSAINNFLLSASKKSNLTIIGGAKLETKLGLIKSLAAVSSHVVVGGGIAGHLIKNKFPNMLTVSPEGFFSVEDKVSEDLFYSLKKIGAKLVLPVDAYVLNKSGALMLDIEHIDKDDKICDIGSKSLNIVGGLILQSKTVIWNGPLGICEDEKFAKGTQQIATLIAKLTADGKIKSLSGGGETMCFLEKHNLNKMFSHVSTGGGAMLKYIEFSGNICGLTAIVK